MKPVNPTDAVCARCGEGYGAPAHNPRGYMSHEFVCQRPKEGQRPEERPVQLTFPFPEEHDVNTCDDSCEIHGHIWRALETH